MGVTPARLVTSGFFRVHLWVIMGMQTFAAAMIYTQRPPAGSDKGASSLLLVLSVSLAILAYLGAVVWLYEAARLGKLILLGIAVACIAGGIITVGWQEGRTALSMTLRTMDFFTSGLLLGTIITAMFLGHWYLNTPTMDLVPLRRLVAAIFLSVAVRGLVCGVALGAQWSLESISFGVAVMLVLRWISGIFAPLGLTVLTWQTLKIPNTQSATGILYATVLFALIGELTSQLLSADALYAL